MDIHVFCNRNSFVLINADNLLESGQCTAQNATVCVLNWEMLIWIGIIPTKLANSQFRLHFGQMLGLLEDTIGSHHTMVAF